MTQEEQIIIPLSKKKLALTLLGAVAFVALGLWFIISPPKTSNPILGNPTLIFSVGVASIIFFGIAIVTVIRKLSDNKAGLIINQKGIIDNSSGVSAGLVLWTDIEEIKVSRVMDQKFLVIAVRNPQDYLDKVKNPLKRKTMEANYKSYGSPICISANSLKTDFDNLHSLLTEKIKNHV